MQIPIKIDPCPITEALVEARFSANVPEGAVFGIYYNKIRADYSPPVKLPILQVPEQIRTKELAFKYAPHYKMQKDNIVLQVGPNCLLVSMINNYLGWDAFSHEVFSAIDNLVSTGIIEKFHRIGLRYINTFKFNIFEKLNLCFSLNDKNLGEYNSFITTNISDEQCSHVVRIANNATFAFGDNSPFSGSIIDIDTSVDEASISDSSQIKEAVCICHNSEKKIFFGLLKDTFIKELNPEFKERT